MPGRQGVFVNYDFQRRDTEGHLRNMARSLCENFSVLQEKGHPKWREAELALPDLGRGWAYFGPTTREIRACIAGKPKLAIQVKSQTPTKTCPQQERILGLCGWARYTPMFLLANTTKSLFLAF